MRYSERQKCDGCENQANHKCCVCGAFVCWHHRQVFSKTEVYCPEHRIQDPDLPNSPLGSNQPTPPPRDLDKRKLEQYD